MLEERMRADLQSQSAQPVALPEGGKSAGPIVVGVAGSPDSLRLIRAAAGLARDFTGPWYVVHVRPGGGNVRRDRAAVQRLDRMLSFAQRLGANTATLEGGSIAKELVGFAREVGASTIVIGAPEKEIGLLNNSLARRLKQAGDGLEVHSLAVSGPRNSRWRAVFRSGFQVSAGLYPFVLASALTFAAALFARALRQAVPTFDGMSLPLLGVVVFVAVQHGTLPGLFAALLGGVTFALFLNHPSVGLSDIGSLTSLGLFIVVALLASHLAGRIRAQVLSGTRREARLRALFRLSRDVAAAAGSQDILRAIVNQIDDILGAQTVVLLPSGPEGLLQVAYPESGELPPADAEAAEWAFHFDDMAGRGTNTVDEAARLYCPMRANDHAVGVLGMGQARENQFRDPEYRWLFDALATLAAAAIERMNLARQLADARVVAESDSIRAALLSSISHDLRTPLSTIIGSASTLQRYGANLDEATRLDLLNAIREEAERLNRFIRNLLDMTRIESGAIVPKAQPVALADIVGSALERLEGILDLVQVRTEIAPDLPLAKVDFVLMEQVVVNLLENAIKYSPKGSRVDLTVGTDPERRYFRISVADEGMGVATKDLAHIFDKFYRARSGDRRIAGTGLGLSICKGLVEAQGGTIHVQSAGLGMGSRFWVELPLDTEQPAQSIGMVDVERS